MIPRGLSSVAIIGSSQAQARALVTEFTCHFTVWTRTLLYSISPSLAPFLCLPLPSAFLLTSTFQRPYSDLRRVNFSSLLLLTSSVVRICSRGFLLFFCFFLIPFRAPKGTEPHVTRSLVTLPLLLLP